MSVKASQSITIGLDIGIASVGWAVLAPQRIVALGVRCFDKAETADKGEPLNLARRTARLARRRLRRRAWRLKKLSRVLKQFGVLADPRTLTAPPKPGTPCSDTWKLRIEGLDRQLTPEEWARVIYHLCKHRGFHWISRAEEKKAESDQVGGAVKRGLSATNALMREKNYRTAAEMVVHEFPDARRNKQGDYGKSLSRVLLADELKQLFNRQRHLSNPHADERLEERILGNGDRKSGLFWMQKPPLSGEALLRMLGRCTFEKGKYRAPKASFTAERHGWLTRLNNLRIVIDGKTRPLTSAERRIALPLPYERATDLKYKHLRDSLVKAGLSNEFRFAGLAYPSERQKTEDHARDPEDQRLIKLPGWQELRKTLKDAGLDTVWRSLSSTALDGKPQLLDEIARVLSVYKEDTEVQAELARLDIPQKQQVIDALLSVRFDGFSNLSLAALYAILPHMEAGLRYDEACAKAGYDHSVPGSIGGTRSTLLPPLYTGRDRSGRLMFNADLDVPRNPVVLRAINQARKVVNAIIRVYGPPGFVHIEMARELSKPFDERKNIAKAQEEFRDRNEKDRAAFNAEHNSRGALKGKDFEKWQLYREQQGKCAYSVEPIDIDRLFETGYVEIDHALPYSRSFDNSRNNRVLVLARENRNKGNLTPYEYLAGGHDTEQWRRFVAFVQTNKSYRQAKRNRLLRKDFDLKAAEEFRERNLTDTRYICRFFKNYIERHLQLAQDSGARRCLVLSGQLTAFLRARWGLVKVREENDRHHALDAVVAAACSHAMVKRLSDYSRRKELEAAREGFVDPETGEVLNPAMLDRLERHFPTPWPYFRDELKARLTTNDPIALREAIASIGTYPAEALAALKPLFVSRAPQRRNGGAAHKDTIYAQSERFRREGSVTHKVAVTDLKLSDLASLVDPHRNERLYECLRTWLSTRDERVRRANGIEKAAKDAKRELTVAEKREIDELMALPRKPNKHGQPTGPTVRSVTKVIDSLSGIPVHGGIAKNDTMLRIDVFRKTGKYHLVPVYVHHAAKGLPDRAIVAYKDEEEWTCIDGFDFCFSLYPNDLVKVILRNEVQFGYYASCDRSTGAISLWAHDRNAAIGKGGLVRGIGVKTALALEKFSVDVLGNVFPVASERRRDLA